VGTVAAVIVTYNRLAKLRLVVSSVLSQSRPVDLIVIVDNNSTDDTAAYLEDLAAKHRQVKVLALPENTGGAGGFSAGMEYAHSLGADFVWVMDDDGYPEPEALRTLEKGIDEASKALDSDVPFACSVVKFIDGTICEMNNPVPTWDWGRLIALGQSSVLVSSCSFVSVLIPRWVLETHGLPYAEYFIWYDDAEYTRRITSVCPGVQILASEVLHDMGVNQGVSFGMIDDSNAWKFRYGVRNEGSYRLHHQGWFQYLLFAAVVTRQMRQGRVAFHLKRKMWAAMLSAITFNPKIRHVTSGK